MKNFFIFLTACLFFQGNLLFYNVSPDRFSPVLCSKAVLSDLFGSSEILNAQIFRFSSGFDNPLDQLDPFDQLDGFSQQDGKPSIKAVLSKQKIFIGETVQYRLIFKNIDSDFVPQNLKLKNFDVQYLNEQNSSFVQTINGKTTQSVDKTYIYRLTPLTSGLLTIPGPQIKMGKQTIQADSLMLEVKDIEKQDIVLLDSSVSPNPVYPTQRFNLQLDIYIKAFSDNENIEMLSLLFNNGQIPTLQIPWATDDALPDSLLPEEEWDRWLTNYQSLKGGFSINQIQARSRNIFDDFFDSRTSGQLMMFMPEPELIDAERVPPLEKLEASQKSSDEKSPAKYWKYSFCRSFSADAVGKISFPPIILKGNFVKEEKGETFLESIYAIGEIPVINIENVPADKRPENYIGVFGEFDWDGTLSQQKSVVGEPLTLTLTLKGTGAFLNAEAPNLEKNPEINRLFKLTKSPTVFKNDGCQFIWTIRPKVAGNLIFPPIAISYFDVEKGKFVEKKTSPISLSVSGSTVLPSSQKFGYVFKNQNENKNFSENSLLNVFSNRLLTEKISFLREDYRKLGLAATLFFSLSCFLFIVKFSFEKHQKSGVRYREQILLAARLLVEEGLKNLSSSKNQSSLQSTLPSTANSVSNSDFISKITETAGCFRRALIYLTQLYKEKKPEKNVSAETVSLGQEKSQTTEEILVFFDRHLKNNLSKQDVRNILQLLDETQFSVTVPPETEQVLRQFFERWDSFVSELQKKPKIQPIRRAEKNKPFFSDSQTSRFLGFWAMLTLLTLTSVLLPGCRKENVDFSVPSQNQNSSENLNRPQTFKTSDEMLKQAEELLLSIRSDESFLILSDSEMSKKSENVSFSNSESTEPPVSTVLSDKTQEKETTNEKLKQQTEKDLRSLEQAIALYEAVLKQQGESGNLHAQLGILYAKIGQKGKALVQFRLAERFLPASLPLANALESLALGERTAPQKTWTSQLFFWQSFLGVREEIRLFQQLLFFLFLIYLGYLFRLDKKIIKFYSQRKKTEKTPNTSNDSDSFQSAAQISSSFETNKLEPQETSDISLELEDVSKNLRNKTSENYVENEDNKVRNRETVPTRFLAKILILFILLTVYIGFGVLSRYIRYERLEYGVINSSDAIPRSGNNDKYGRAFPDPLPEYSEFTVNEKRGDWVQVRFANGNQGWFSSDSILIY